MMQVGDEVASLIRQPETISRRVPRAIRTDRRIANRGRLAHSAMRSDAMALQRRYYIPVIVAVLIGVILAALARSQPKVEIQGLALVKPGMTRSEVLALLGPPIRQKSTTMAVGIYGVPDQMETKIGLGKAFEMWEYEKSTAPKSVTATIWFCPETNDSAAEVRVIEVTTQTVLRTLGQRLVDLIADTLGLND
jgi:hypothetical protein